MGDVITQLGQGFGHALTPENLAFALLGCFIGTFVGVLPGIGPITAIALLIPLSFGLDPISGLILLAAVYYGSMYGGSTTSILIRTPGDVASIVTSIDGHEMAKQGRAGAALATAAIGSFVAGTFSIIALTLLAPALASVATVFGAAEYFLMMLLALLLVSNLSTSSPLKTLIAVLFGISLSMVGMDPQMGSQRFTFGLLELTNGLDLALLAIALFAVPEALKNLSQRGDPSSSPHKVQGRIWMSRDDWRRSAGPYGRGTIVGFLIGLLPGIGPSLASFVSYVMEKRVSKHPEQFGRGAIEGVAGPETANNAAVGGAMAPMFALGIPGSGTTALLLFVFMMYGLQPGPQLFDTRPDVIFAILASMYIGNVILLLLNLPLVGLFVQVLKTPTVPLYTAVLGFAVLGVYALKFTQFDLFVLLGFGLVGYLMQRFGIPAAPAVLAFVLGRLMEENLRRSLTISESGIAVFVQRPLSLTLLALTFLVVAVPPLVRTYRARNRPADQSRTVAHDR